MKRIISCAGFFAIISVAFGCSSTEAPASDGTLGIARFAVDESADRTVVRGLDASGSVVGRLEVVHGTFALSPPFTDDYATPTVDGRKLTVEIAGQRLRWETAGYEPTLHMPAHPPDQWAITAFLDDPHAKAVLDQWKIGFEPSKRTAPTDTELPYFVNNNSYDGTDPMNCENSNTCGSAYYGTINTCGGSDAAWSAWRVTQTQNVCGAYANQVVVQQCCGAGTGGQTVDWWAVKACPTTADNNTFCGTRTAGACKGCGAYDAHLGCKVWGYNPSYCGGANYSVTSQFDN